MKHVPDPNHNKQAAALMALADIAPAEEMNDKVIKVGGARNLSTFFGYYILQAQALAMTWLALLTIFVLIGEECLTEALQHFKDFNIEWLEGSGRIDELVPEGVKDLHGDFGNFCKGFRHSLCHGWASGPTAFMSGYVLGIQVLNLDARKLE